MKNRRITQAYCPYCDGQRELRRPKRSTGIWIAATILTLGWGLILYPLAHYLFTNKTQCHTCNAKIASYWTRTPLFKQNDQD